MIRKSRPTKVDWRRRRDRAGRVKLLTKAQALETLGKFRGEQFGKVAALRTIADQADQADQETQLRNDETADIR